MFYWPNVKIKQTELNDQGEQLSVKMVKDTISSFELHLYANDFYLSLCREHMKG